MRALFLLATAATAFQPKTTQKPTTKLQAKVGDALGAGRQRFCCGLAPLDPPAPGTEFMHPLLLSGAAKTLREAGAARSSSTTPWPASRRQRPRAAGS